MTDKKAEIYALIAQAQSSLEKARELTEGLERDSTSTWQPYESFYFDGPAYGMGGSLRNGEWHASSESC